MNDHHTITKDQWEDIVCQLDDLVNLKTNNKQEQNSAIDDCAGAILEILCLNKPDEE